jgi:GT2 family glycosyltransferase
MDLSICIPTRNARAYLAQCLESISRHPPKLDYEIIVVDIGSDDGTCAWLAEAWPQVQIIRLEGNQGFTKPMNLAFAQAQGAILLALNADTLLEEDAFTPQINYLHKNPQVGVSIPRVLNPDGSLQTQSRRGDPKPMAVFGHHLGLGKLFKRSRALNAYQMPWLDNDAIAEVDAVSGSCMFITRACYESTGGFDEDFFAYQEDSDLCLRARKAGFKVMVVPISSIIHFSGKGGSRHQPYKQIYEWHRSYFTFYRKHYARQHFFLFNAFYYLLMGGKLALAMLKNIFRPTRQ